MLYQSDNDYSAGLYNAFVAECEKTGVTIKETQTFTAATATDFSTQVNALVNSGVKVVFIPIYAEEVSTFLTQVKGKFAEDVYFFGGDGLDGILGKAMRAVSEDKSASILMGISVDKTITLTFAIGSALAAFASIFYGMTYVYIKPTTGAMPGIKAFTAAVFGGIGSIPGAMLGGILLGMIEQFSKTYISTLWADAIVFGVLVVVLVTKPTGLLGKPMQEKV